ncbi:MAG: agmatinase [Candidatus Micrarchaeota archaeon]|nr:agmatinase [Candidatus Micrarchaeota archaeon]
MKLFHSNTPYTFLGVDSDFKKARVGVLPVPYDSTASYRTGMRHGPQAIIDASRQLELFDIEAGKEIGKEIGFFTFDELQCSKKDPAQVIKAVQESVEEILAAGKWPLMLGGEHSLSSGAVAACKEKFGELTVLHIDAHADMRPEYEGTPYNHASVMARCRAMGPVVSVGVRSYSIDEAKEVRGKYKDVVFDASPLTEARVKEIVGKIKTDKVYISIDIDGFDPAVMPAVGTPEPGGLQWMETLRLLKEVGQKKTVVGADVVELCPIPGNVIADFACAKLCYKLAGYCLLKK